MELLLRGVEASGLTSAVAGLLGGEADALVSGRKIPMRLGSFDLEREIGRGGMGIVYLGRDTRLDRMVAIKAIAEDIACIADLRARFEREARLLAAVDHPDVATIHTLEEHDGELLLVMEYLEGAGLEERLRHGALGVEETVRVGAKIAAALEAEECQREALAIAREVGDRFREGTILGNLSNLHAGHGRPDEALHDHLGALAIARETGFRVMEAVALCNRGSLRASQGRLDEALRHLDQPLATARELDYRLYEGHVLGHVGELHSQQGRLAEAEAAFEAGEIALREVEHPESLCGLLCAKGRRAARTGDAEGARAVLVEAATLGQRIGAGAASSLGRAIARLRESVGEAGTAP